MKFTVIIPTRERADVLGAALRSVTSQPFDDLEIIVSDNASADHTRDVVLSNVDKRLRYIRTDRRLGMSGNWEFAMSHATGDWVTIIGDDDALLPGSLASARDLIEQNPGLAALRSAVCQYQWPSVVGQAHGRIQVPLGQGVEIRSGMAMLRATLFGRLPYTGLPMLYNGGFVRRSALEAIRGEDGRLYRSCIPDVYSAVSVARTAGRYIYSHRPLAVNGASRHSTGTSTFSNPAAGKMESATKFQQEDNIPMHEDVPPLPGGRVVPSLPALVFESYRQSMFLSDEVPLISPAEVLEVVLRDRRATADTLVWAQSFAERHRLDFETARRSVAAGAGLRRVGGVLETVGGVLNAYALGSNALPITDVFAASCEAGRLLSDPPSRARNALRLLGSVTRKAIGRQASGRP